MEPTLLVEDFDLASDGYKKHYAAWFDVGGSTPIYAYIGQQKTGNRRELRWFAAAWIAEVNGQTPEQPVIRLARSDMEVRDLASDHGEEERLTACRADALLLAERMERIVGAIDKELVKGPALPGRKRK